MNVQQVMSVFQEMLDRHWPYVLNAAKDSSSGVNDEYINGTVDCSGAFVVAWKRFGMTIPHGSNAIARQCVKELIPAYKANPQPGMIAFKHRVSTNSKYALPEKYKKGSDQNDYYHIGMVGEDGETVLNAQGVKTGFVSSPISQNWTYFAYAKDIIYEGDEIIVPDARSAKVVAETGKTVNLRKTMDTKSIVIERVPVGAPVTVDADFGEWVKITHNGKTGYMISNYIDYADMPDDTSDEETDWKAIVQDVFDLISPYMGVG